MGLQANIGRLQVSVDLGFPNLSDGQATPTPRSKKKMVVYNCLTFYKSKILGLGSLGQRSQPL